MTEVDDFLSHHGVKGMKWGQRRKQKELALFKRMQLASEISRKKSLPGRISDKAYSKLSTKDVNIASANSNLHRVSGHNQKVLRDITYVTVNKDDHNRYLSVLAPDGGRSRKTFDVSITTSEALISPSKKTRIDTYIETLGSEIPIRNGRQTVLGRELIAPGSTANKALTNRELGLQTYNLFAKNQVHNTPVHSAYFDSLKAKGYNSLVDDSDIGVYAKLPVIIFPKESGAQIVSAKKLSTQDKIEALMGSKLLSEM